MVLITKAKLKEKSKHKKRPPKRRNHDASEKTFETRDQSDVKQDCIDELALKVRARLFGLTPLQARDPMSATYVGRLAIIGQKGGISNRQYEAAERYMQIYNNYKKAIASPDAYYDGDSKLADEDEFENWCKQAKEEYFTTLKVIQDEQAFFPHENLFASLQYIVAEDKEFPYLVGPLRLVLNALDRHFHHRFS